MEHQRNLAQPSSRFAGDAGDPDPLVRAAIAATAHPADPASAQRAYVRAVVALCTARLLMPVVATGDETAEAAEDRGAELGAVTLATDGATHLLAFTGLDSLRAWQADARPVLCHLDELAATVEPAGAARLLVDVAGPVPLVIADDVLAQLAAGRRLVEFDDGGFGWAQSPDG